MVDPVIGQGALQRLSDVILADNLGECVGTVAPVERKRRSTGRASARVIEQRLILNRMCSIWSGCSDPASASRRSSGPASSTQAPYAWMVTAGSDAS